MLFHQNINRFRAKLLDKRAVMMYNSMCKILLFERKAIRYDTKRT